MTKISRTALKAQIDADIRVNGNREITPPKHNAIETNIIDSNLNLVDGGWVVQVEAGYLTELSLTDNRSFAHKKYVDDSISSIPLANYYLLSGDTLEGDMDAGGFNIEGAGQITALNGFSTDGVASIFSDTVNDRYFYGKNAGAGLTGISVIAMGNGAGSAAVVSYSFMMGTSSGAGSSGIVKTLIGAESGQGSTGNYLTCIGPGSGKNSTITSGTFAGTFSGEDCTASIFTNGFGEESAKGSTGAYSDFFGAYAGKMNMAAGVKAFGYQSAQDNDKPNIFTVAGITDVFWNNVGNKGYTTLQDVFIQTAMSLDGVNQSASASNQCISAALATGNATPGDVKFMYAVPGSSGSTRQSRALSATMNGPTGNWKFEKIINLTLTDYASNALAISGGLSVGDLYRTSGVVMVVI